MATPNFRETLGAVGTTWAGLAGGEREWARLVLGAMGVVLPAIEAALANWSVYFGGIPRR